MRPSRAPLRAGSTPPPPLHDDATDRYTVTVALDTPTKLMLLCRVFAPPALAAHGLTRTPLSYVSAGALSQRLRLRHRELTHPSTFT